MKRGTLAILTEDAGAIRAGAAVRVVRRCGDRVTVTMPEFHDKRCTLAFRETVRASHLTPYARLPEKA